MGKHTNITQTIKSPDNTTNKGFVLLTKKEAEAIRIPVYSYIIK